MRQAKGILTKPKSEIWAQIGQGQLKGCGTVFNPSFLENLTNFFLLNFDKYL